MKTILVTGCFDILHPGHVTLLKHAHTYAGFIVVGINSDDSVRRLKGDGRPVNNEADRAAMLDALWMVGDVVVMEGDDASRTLLSVEPTYWLKGGDYTWETISEAEREACDAAGVEFLTMPKVDGYSTSGVIDRMKGAM